MKGFIKKIKYINTVKDSGYSNSPSEGFLCNNELNKLFLTLKFPVNKNFEMVGVSEFGMNKQNISLIKTHKIPFPKEIWFKNEDEKNETKNYDLEVCGQILNFGNKIFFLNGLDIYDLESNQIFFSLNSKGKYNNKRIRSFYLFGNNKNNENPSWLLYQEEVLNKPGYVYGQKFLVLYDLKKSKIISRIYIGENVGKIIYKDKNHICFFKENKTHVVIFKYIIKEI
jgi:hypothetical protein